VRVLDKNRKVIYNGDSVDGAADAIAFRLQEAEQSLTASAKRPVSSGYPDFKSKEQVKRYYLDKGMMATTAIQKLKDLGISEDEATDTVRDWQYEKK